MNLQRALKLVRESREDITKIDELENLIIEAMKLERVVEVTTKVRYNRAKRVLARSKNREVLRHTVERENKQYFTDGYIMFELTNKIPELPIIDDESRYPRLDTILTKAKDTNGEVVYNCKELKQMIKVADNIVELELDATYKAVVNKDYLLDVLTILEYKNSEEVVIKCNTSTKGFRNSNYIITPLLFERNNDVAILLPIAKENN